MFCVEVADVVGGWKTSVSSSEVRSINVFLVSEGVLGSGFEVNFGVVMVAVELLTGRC